MKVNPLLQGRRYNSKRVKCTEFKKKMIFITRTSASISNILGSNPPWVNGIHKGQVLFREDIITKIG
jgi:hypothetical protein